MSSTTLQEFGKKVNRELKSNILKFWIDNMVDYENGGFYGRISNDMEIDKEAPKGLVLNTRILWTFSAAYRLFGDEEYLTMAKRAYEYIVQHFWDNEFKGGYWMLDYKGNPIDTKKQVYGEAFTIYGLAEYHRATGDKDSLNKAIELFNTLEKHAYDQIYKGYFEGYTREWGYSEDLMISAVEHPDSKKTMNTHLHMMEAYTNLLRVWDDQVLRSSLKEMTEAVIDYIIDHNTWHFKLFLDEKWNSLSDEISFGHDIEGSWLIVEAAEILGDENLLKKTEEIALNMAQAVLDEGTDIDGGIFYEANPEVVFNKSKVWWPQSEAVVGFFNAYQMSKQKKFLDATVKCWDFIEDKLVDKVHGEWFEYIKEDGSLPTPKEAKADMWKCPYHNSRTCFEVLERLSRM